MKVQFNTDKNITGKESLEAYVAGRISDGLRQFDEKITRIEVHLSDENAHKTGKDDIHCKLEARLEGLQPITVTGKGETKEKAVSDSISKMKAVLSTTVGKMKEHH
ncbi:MAG: HPF/RaiA family ribosome-associated protein [Crocinitomicaceae bacterium]|nr:HPF/RaiA family ribosome-associated protein [Crocinitomicaceae bacterium]